MATRTWRNLSVNSSQENGDRHRAMATRTWRNLSVNSSQENGTDTEQWLKEHGGIYLLILVKRMGQTQSDGYQNREEAVC